jgi:hypothetical protein
MQGRVGAGSGCLGWSWWAVVVITMWACGVELAMGWWAVLFWQDTCTVTVTVSSLPATSYCLPTCSPQDTFTGLTCHRNRQLAVCHFLLPPHLLSARYIHGPYLSP